MAISAAPARERLLDALEQLANSRAPEARLVLQTGPVYLMWIARRGEDQLEQESVSSTALPPAFKLTTERGMLLRELGFAKPSGRRNWKRRHPRARASLVKIADETLDILARVYGADQAIVLSICEDPREHPQNPALLAAMRELAGNKGVPGGAALAAGGGLDARRRAMYSNMLNATFLVPINLEPDPDAEGSEAFHVFETHPSGRPTLGVFTDWASLRLWEPRGHEYWPIHGSRMFGMALERRPVTLRINPQGDVGGELYAHEVEMLVRAVKSVQS
ncbi:hypothetical protein DB30_01990 [Enhygromyxa salina]|uniref:Uncharacterized protein n=1 Tax=Enhygromyxa salina TaxID=215803 RepID=A0A0C2A3Y6_9BACT|nr:SseB family protein [Enhygromyxa salina]KIG18103.1 hypothetical protein DB30_01990 [Enhygromyxa salina]